MGAPDAQRRFHVTYHDPTRRSEPIFGELAFGRITRRGGCSPMLAASSWDGRATRWAGPGRTPPPSRGRLAAQPASVPGRWAQNAVNRERLGGERYGQETQAASHTGPGVALGVRGGRSRPAPQAEAQGVRAGDAAPARRA